MDHFINILPANQDRKHLRLEPAAVTVGTDVPAHESLQLFPHGVAPGFPVALLQHGDDAVPGTVVLVGITAEVCICKFESFRPGAPLQFFLHGRFQIVPAVVQIVPVLLQEHVQQPHIEGCQVAGHGRNGSVGKAFILIRQDQFPVVFPVDSQAAAGGAGAVRSVKGKEPGLDFRQADAAVGAGEFFRINLCVPADDLHFHHAVRQLQGRFHRIAEALLDPFPHRHTVDDHGKAVLLLFIQNDFFIQCPQFAVHQHAGVTGPAHVVDDVLVFPFAPVH